MGSSVNDILQEIPKEEWPKLRDYYEKHIPYATHIYSFVNTMIKWNTDKPERHFLTFYAPNGDWESDGTFVALLEWHCYDIMCFTMDPNCDMLYKSIKESNRINYTNNKVMFYALHKDHKEAVFKALNERSVPINSETRTDYYWIPKEEAKDFEFECPKDYYIAKLKPEHAKTIDDVWPHRYPGSIEYLKTFIEMSGGHGVFTKDGNKLVTWVLKCHMGTLSQLQTDEDFKRKGLGTLVTKSLSKEIALEGHNPVGTVLQNNVASQSMFSKLNFRVLDWNSFVEAGNKQN